MSTYYEQLQKSIEEYKNKYDNSFLELKSLYMTKRSWKKENFEREEERIKKDIDLAANEINRQKDLLASYDLVNNYTEDIIALTKMYNEETNIKIKDQISNQLLNKRDFINNKLNNLPKDLSDELRKIYLESTYNIEDNKIKELEVKKTKILEILNKAKEKTEESKKNMMNIFEEERFIIENEGPFKTVKELDDFYEKYMNKKIKENENLIAAKKRQENLEKKLKIINERISDRREAISTANKININVDDYESILTRIKKRDYVTSLFESMGLNELVDLRKKAIYPTKEELEEYRKKVIEKLIAEKINQRKRSSIKSLPGKKVIKNISNDYKEVTDNINNKKITHIEIIDKLKDNLNKNNTKSNRANNIIASKVFIKELNSKKNLYNVIHTTPKVTDISQSVLTRLSSNIMKRDTAKEKLKAVKERLNNLSEKELMILYKQYGKHDENNRFDTGINNLIKDRISSFVNEKSRLINKNLENNYEEIFNCVKELNAIDMLTNSKNTNLKQKIELEKYKEKLVHGKSNTILKIRKAYEEAELFISSSSFEFDKNLRNRFYKNHDLDIEVLEKEKMIKNDELQAIKDGNDEEALRCFVERECLLSKKIEKEHEISNDKKYYSKLAEQLDNKDDYLSKEINKNIAIVGSSLNTLKLIKDENTNYVETKKNIQDFTTKYSQGLITNSKLEELLDNISSDSKEYANKVVEEIMPELEKYSRIYPQFNIVGVTNIINFMKDFPEAIADANNRDNKISITEEQMDILDTIPKDINNKLMDSITANALATTTKNLIKNIKLNNSNNISDLLNNFVDNTETSNNKRR